MSHNSIPVGIKLEIENSIISLIQSYLVKINYLEKLATDGITSQMGIEYSSKNGNTLDFTSIALEPYLLSIDKPVYKYDLILWYISHDIVGERNGRRQIYRPAPNSHSVGKLTNLELQINFDSITGTPSASVIRYELSEEIEIRYN